MHALHRGSRFCQAGLFFTIAVQSWRADPAAVWLCKAVEAARLIGRVLGRQALETMYLARTEGPIAGLKKVLGWAGLELRGTRLCAGPEEGPCVVSDARCELKIFVLAGIRHRDLAKASRRQDQGGLGAADVAEGKHMLRALPMQGLQEAARAVATGDVVTRGQSRTGKSTTRGAIAEPRRRQ